MKTTAKKQTRRLSKEQKILIAIAGVIVAIAGWWLYVSFMPHPLGDRLEYLGKKDFGGGLFFYDYHPSSEYYYGTDMNADEMRSYFKNASYAPIENLSFQHAHFTTSDHKSFLFTYLSEADIVSNISDLKTTSKRFVISISQSGYEIAKKSL